MSSPMVPPPPARIPGRALAALLALAAGLGVAFVVAPGTLAANRSSGGFADNRKFLGAVHESFDGYWRSGDRDFPPALKEVVGYWFRYHLVKAGLSVLLLAVFVALAVVAWRAFLRGGGLRAGRSVGLGSAGVAAVLLALISLVTVMANVQGAVAPFASLLPMVSEGPADAARADTLEQVRQHLADSGGSHQSPPPLQVMISDFARYHVAMAVIAPITAVIFIGLSVMFWRRFAGARQSPRRTRRTLGSFGVLTALLALACILVGVANVTTAAQPTPALLALFNGGW